MFDKLDFILEKYEELSLKVSDPDIISNQPDGQYYIYSRSGMAYLNTWLGVAYDELSGRIAEMVFTDDGICYLKNVISQYDCDSWIEGSVDGSS